jgi:hypothetical protein
MREHASNQEAADYFLESFAKEKGGQWMAAVWSVEDGRIRLHSTTHKFLKDDYLSAVGLLSNHLFEKNRLEANKLPDTPLPPAKGFDPWPQRNVGFDPQSLKNDSLAETGPFDVVNEEPVKDNGDGEIERGNIDDHPFIFPDAGDIND